MNINQLVELNGNLIHDFRSSLAPGRTTKLKILGHSVYVELTEDAGTRSLKIFLENHLDPETDLCYTLSPGQVCLISCLYYGPLVWLTDGSVPVSRSRERNW
jgi:hypothetical protein